MVAKFRRRRVKGLAIGRLLRDEALYHLEYSSENRLLWRRRGYVVALQLAQQNPEHTVTTDDLEEVYPVPDEWDRRVLGTIFRPKRNGFALRRIGEIQSTQRQCHGRWISLWKLKRGYFDD